MALIGNYSSINKSLARFSGGGITTATSHATYKSNWENPSINRSKDISIPANQSIPTGYGWGSAFVIARSEGGIGSTMQMIGTGSISANALNVKLSSVDITGSGLISNADLASIVPIVSALAGSGTISSAAISAAAQMISALTGSGVISNAQVSATIPIEASAAGSSSMSPNLTGRGSISADILPFTDLSPEGLAFALLDANDIETGMTMREALRIMLSAMAGKVSGAETTTVTIRNTSDTISRIIATVDANGNRTAVTLDASEG